jgi:hypothetical protein
VLALLKFRRRAGWKRSRWVDLAYPLIPMLYVVMNAWVFVYFAQLRIREALWSLLTVVGAALVYHFYIRKRTVAASAPHPFP